MSSDKFYYKNVMDLAKRSVCHGRKVGVLITDSAGAFLVEGWNTTLQHDTKCKDSCYKRSLGHQSGEGLDVCPAIHAEAKCIAVAAYRGVATQGGTLYISTCIPCKSCLRLIILAGISEIVCAEDEFYDEESRLIVAMNNDRLTVRTFNLKEK